MIEKERNKNRQLFWWSHFASFNPASLPFFSLSNSLGSLHLTLLSWYILPSLLVKGSAWWSPVGVRGQVRVRMFEDGWGFAHPLVFSRDSDGGFENSRLHRHHRHERIDLGEHQANSQSAAGNGCILQDDFSREGMKTYFQRCQDLSSLNLFTIQLSFIHVHVSLT